MQLEELMFLELNQLATEYQQCKADIERLSREKTLAEKRISLLRELLDLEGVSLTAQTTTAVDGEATTP